MDVKIVREDRATVLFLLMVCRVNPSKTPSTANLRHRAAIFALLTKHGAVSKVEKVARKQKNAMPKL